MDRDSILRNRRKLAPGVLKQSAKLMSAQSKSKREKFDSWPEFVKCTLHHDSSEDFEVSWRKLPVEERLPFSKQLRAAGNDLYGAGRYEEAVDKYAKAAGLFHYVQKTGAGYDGTLEDRCLSLVTDEGDEDTHWNADARDTRIACYSNIAQCILRQGEPNFVAAGQACDLVLALDPANAKALYRRAMAFEGLGSAAALESAMKDLAKASSLEPGSTSVQAAKQRITAELRKQREAEKQMFRGFLNRDSNGIGGSEEREHAAAQLAESEAATEAEGADIQRTIDEATKLREAYLAEGRMKDARTMEKRIECCEERLAERRDRDVNIFKPSAELMRRAQQFGIDLRDPKERREVDRLMWEAHRATAGGSFEEPEEEESDGINLRKQALTRAKDLLIIMVLALAVCWVWLLSRQALR